MSNIPIHGPLACTCTISSLKNEPDPLVYWIHIWLHFGGRHVICQTLLCLYKGFWLVIASLYYIAATENLLSTLQFAELARDWLHSTGKYAVEGGIISPVHDAYGKKVHGHNYVKTAYMCYSLMWLHPVLHASCSHLLDRNFCLLALCMC